MRLRNLSPRYIEVRTITLRRVARQIGRDPLTATPETLRDWQQKRRVAPATLYGEISHLIGYTQWAWDEGLIGHDPCALLVTPKLSRRVPRPAVEAELLQAIATAPRRVRLMLVLAGFEGLRAIELARLERCDILESASPPVMILRGKGAKERVVPLSAPVLSEIRRYQPPHTGPVFERGDGQHGHNSGARISQIVSEYLREGRFTFTLHQARHRFATDVYRDTRDLRLVQELLGHSNPQTTAIYTAFAQRAAVEAVSRTSHNLDDRS
jgi:integrase/recombinase XerC